MSPNLSSSLSSHFSLVLKPSLLHLSHFPLHSSTSIPKPNSLCSSMADAVSTTPKPQIPQISPDHANTSKFFTPFLYKAAIVTLLLVFLPIFPSLAPEFINQTLHARSWEFLQLIFVGIAVSYGLFSKRNDDEPQKDHTGSTKLDNAQSYVSKLLQVPSVFEDEPEHQIDENNNVQTWSSQYYREEPVVLVAKESPSVKQNSSIHSEIRQKPLLLPVRSLKQRVHEEETHRKTDLIDDSGGKQIGHSNSKRFSKPRIGELEVGGLNPENENVVLRSPIPWRSRSGRIEMNENGDRRNTNEFIFSPSIDNRVDLNSRSFRSSKPNLPSFSSESQSKSSEDVIKKKNPSPIPPPPPPPSQLLRKSNSSVINSGNEKVLRRTFRSVPTEEFSETETEEEPPRSKTNDSRNGSQSGRSVRTFKTSSDDYKTNVVDEKVVMESSDDEDLESEEDDYFEDDIISSNITAKSSATNVVDDNCNNDNSVNSEVEGGPDVDKKADEFIAKFREQIRLQRIESIRRSTAQRAGKTNLR